MKITLKRMPREVPMQVDYEKLEKAVSSAILKTAKEQSEQYSVSREWMKVVLYVVFWGIGILVGLVALRSMVFSIKTIFAACKGIIDYFAMVKGMVVLLSSLILFAVSIASCASAKELDREKDRQYIAAMFSNIVALVALIVAFIALFKEAG